nr:hypothetical protein [uncultured Halomonas sp.]
MAMQPVAETRFDSQNHMKLIVPLYTECFGWDVRVTIVWDGVVVAKNAPYTATQANGWRQNTIVGDYEYVSVLDQTNEWTDVYWTDCEGNPGYFNSVTDHEITRSKH